MQQTATAASLQMTEHLRLFLCIDMLVWRESLRPITNAEAWVIHLVMLFAGVSQLSAAQLVSDMCVFNRIRCYDDDAKRARSGV